MGAKIAQPFTKMELRGSRGQSTYYGSGWYLLSRESLIVRSSRFPTGKVMQIEFPIGNIRSVRQIEVFRGWACPRLQVRFPDAFLEMELVPRGGGPYRLASAQEIEVAAVELSNSLPHGTIGAT